MPAAPYAEVRYVGHAIEPTHPSRLAAGARLRGRPAPDPSTSRVLEVGCGEGTNLVSIASSLPGADLVGIDLDPGSIERATATAAALGLGNVRFACADLLDPPAELGTSFDFVVAHGVYSWVPEPVRDGLLALIAERLTADGVAFVSYNAMPGSHVRLAVRELLLTTSPPALPPHERIERARAMLDDVVAGGVTGGFAHELRAHAANLLSRGDHLVLHDELAPVNHGVWFDELHAHVARHGLAFLGDAHLASSQVPGNDPALHAVFDRLDGDLVARERQLDVARGRMYRDVLLGHAPGPARPHVVEPAALAGTWLAGKVDRVADDANGLAQFRLPGGAVAATGDAALAHALSSLGSAWPRAVAFDELAGATARPGELAASLIRLHLERLVDVHAVALPARRAGRRPETSPLARMHAATGRETVISALHTEVRLDDDVGRQLVALLDGSLDRDGVARQLAERLQDGRDVGQLRAGVDASLDRLGDLGVLVG